MHASVSHFSNISESLQTFSDDPMLMKCIMLWCRIVKEEAMRAQLTSPERAMVGRTNGCVETRPIDILELLSKAKEEYNRVSKYNIYNE